MIKEYPTRNGISVALEEINLPKSNLNPDKRYNWNNHHRSFTEKIFAISVLYRTVRQLETQQDLMLLDVHEFLHLTYDPPVLPSPEEAINEILRAKDANERLKIKKGRYIDISDELLKRCIADYESFL